MMRFRAAALRARQPGTRSFTTPPGVPPGGATTAAAKPPPSGQVPPPHRPPSGGGGGGAGMVAGGLLLAGAGGCAAIASNPERAREQLAKVGLLPAAEPLVAALESMLGTTAKVAPPAQPEVAPTEKRAAPTPAKQGAEKKEPAPPNARESAPASKAEAPQTKQVAPQVSKQDSKQEDQATARNPTKADTKQAAAAAAAAAAPGSSSAAAPAAAAEPTQAKVHSLASLASSPAALASGLDALDRPQLEARLASAVQQLRERAKWEALRQHDMWRRAETGAWAKYAELLAEQRTALMLQHEREVSEARSALELAAASRLACARQKLEAKQAEELKGHTAKLQALSAAKALEVEAEVEAALQGKRAEQLSDAWLEACAKAEARAVAARGLGATAQALEGAWRASQAVTGDAAEKHAVGALALRAQIGAPVDASALVEPTAAALGSSSGLEAGPPSEFELARDFEAAYRAGLKAALIPQGLEATGFGRFLGAAFAAVRLPTPTLPAPPGPGGAGSKQVASAEAHLLAAKRAVEQKPLPDLGAAVEALGKLEKGTPAAAEVRDWLGDATARVQSDQTALALKARLLLD